MYESSVLFYLLNINQPAKQMLVGDGKIAA